MSIPILNTKQNDYAENAFNTPSNKISFEQSTNGFTYANDFNNPYKHLNSNSIYYTKPNEPFQFQQNYIPTVVCDTNSPKTNLSFVF
jgi:hypothetical protein